MPYLTVTNTGNSSTGELDVSLSGTAPEAFTLSNDYIPSLAIDGSNTFDVAPNTGLNAEAAAPLPPV